MSFHQGKHTFENMKFNEIKDIDNFRIHAGKFKIKNWSFTRKNIIWWLGTEALVMKIIPPGDFTWQVRIRLKRIRWKIIHRFFEHWVHSEAYMEYLKCVGINKATLVVHWPETETQSRLKINHDGFNVLFYMPVGKRNQTYRDWIYCRNEIELLMDSIKEKSVYFIIADGSLPMPHIWPLVDAFIKPMRVHHAVSRMVMSAELMGIPVLIQDCFKNTLQENINQMKSWLEKEYVNLKEE